ncbi:urease accessory protein UreE [Nitrospirillum sp. BR 11164]|uniref:urease accessory protein UreE n=1 Tax=Nitrospirillum sp. BR 11164 TaxID=3104324 RepID=UPI002AFE41FA|nr:urease accessory protein UreE [Nitrospirillum sp. BR 11164]MEA1647683.1 urease accessory protein UreE [Nitrospirillum sp. BR 11164]
MSEDPSPLTDLPRAHTVLPAGYWDAAKAVGTVTLDFDHRCRRRLRLERDGGHGPLMLDLPSPRHIRHGDGLVLTGVGIVAVKAAPEDLMEVRCDAIGDLLRMAWHIGNRHIPAELRGDRLRIRADHVLADMLTGLGATVTPVSAPFDPEGGAYGDSPAGGGHGHGHDHDHDHDHGHHHHHDHHGHGHG